MTEVWIYKEAFRHFFYPSTSKVSAHVVWTLGRNYKRKLETLARIFFQFQTKTGGVADTTLVQNTLWCLGIII